MIQMRKNQSIFESHYVFSEKPFSEIISAVITDIREVQKFIHENLKPVFFCPIETILQIQLTDVPEYDRACLHDIVLERFEEDGLTEIKATEKINKQVHDDDTPQYILQDIQLRFYQNTDIPLDVFISFFDFPLVKTKIKNQNS